MNEASRRAAMWPYDIGKGVGLSDEEILRGTGLDFAGLKRAKRVDWEVYSAIVGNAHAVLGPEGMSEKGREYAIKPGFKAIRAVAGLFASPRALYHFLARWAGPANNSNIRFSMEDEDGGTIYHTCEIEEGYSDCPGFLHGAKGVMEVVPCLLGLPLAQVDKLEVRERFCAYRIHLPESRTIGSKLRGLFRRGKAIASVPSVLIDQSREIKEQSDALTRQQKDFRQLVDGLNDGVVIVDGDEVLYANEAFRRYVGDGAGVGARWSETLWGPATDGGEVEVESAEGERSLLAFAPPQPVRFGSREGTLLVGRDVTAERDMDERMRVQAMRERRRLAMALHDGLGQQLAGLALKASNLRDGEAGEGELRRGAGELAELARASIELARELAQGLATSDDQPDNVRRALEIECGKSAGLLGIECELDLPEGVQLTMRQVELAEMVCLVREAVNNAFRHGHCTRVMLSLARKGEGWELRVSNDGDSVGLANLVNGDGLGVTSMRFRAHVLGGAIRWDPGEGEGTRVTVSLPDDVVSMESREADTKPSADETSPGRGVVRVLIAEDHQMVREGLVQQVGAAEGLVVCAHTGEREQIVPLARRERPDVVLTDLLMDGADNFDVVRALRSETPAKVVVLSMGAAELYEARALQAGAYAYLMKNAGTEEMISALRDAAAPS